MFNLDYSGNLFLMEKKFFGKVFYLPARHNGNIFIEYKGSFNKNIALSGLEILKDALDFLNKNKNSPDWFNLSELWGIKMNNFFEVMG